MLFQSFLQHEPRLWHRTFKGIDNQQHAINHFHNPFNFTTEVGVAWGIQNVDLVLTVLNGRVLGEDGDTTFTFNGVGIHCPILNFEVFWQSVRLLQHFIDQSSLTMVDVGNDRNVANIITCFQKLSSFRLINTLNFVGQRPCHKKTVTAVTVLGYSAMVKRS